MASNLKCTKDEEIIERYSLRLMSEEESAEFEQHLLVCEACQTKLDETDTFVASVRAAATRIEEPARSRWAIPAWGWAGALALAGISVMVVTPVYRQMFSPAMVIALEATRGEATPQAPAGTSISLRPDVAGLAQQDSYPVELVNASGTTVWTGKTTGSQPSANIPAQKEGVYYVRLYSAQHQLLREYALRVTR